MTAETDDVAAAFVERFGLIAQAQGLSRIAGRIMGLLIMEGGPISFRELGERLQVSRGSVSVNTRLLENLGVVERVGLPGERQDYFRMAPAPYQRLLRVQAEQLARARATIRETVEGLPGDAAGSRDRLGELDRFYASLKASYDDLIATFAADRG